jgi:hypothetical protein
MPLPMDGGSQKLVRGIVKGGKVPKVPKVEMEAVKRRFVVAFLS